MMFNCYVNCIYIILCCSIETIPPKYDKADSCITHINRHRIQNVYMIQFVLLHALYCIVFRCIASHRMVLGILSPFPEFNVFL